MVEVRRVAGPDDESQATGLRSLPVELLGGVSARS